MASRILGSQFHLRTRASFKRTRPQAPAHVAANRVQADRRSKDPVRVSVNGGTQDRPVNLPKTFWDDTLLASGPQSQSHQPRTHTTQKNPADTLKEINNALTQVNAARQEATQALQTLEAHLSSLTNFLQSDLSQEQIINIATQLRDVHIRVSKSDSLSSAERKNLLRQVGKALLSLLLQSSNQTLAKLRATTSSSNITVIDTLIVGASSHVFNPLWSARVIEAHEQKADAFATIKQALELKTEAIQTLRQGKFSQKIDKLKGKLSKASEPEQSTELQTQIDALETEKARLEGSFTVPHTQAMEALLDASRNEKALIWDIMQKAIELRDTGRKSDAIKLMAVASQLQHVFSLRDQSFLNEVVETRSYFDKKVKEQKTAELTLLQKAFDARRNDLDAEFLNVVEQAEQQLHISAAFESARNEPDTPGAIAYEPPYPYGSAAQAAKPFADLYFATSSDADKDQIIENARTQLNSAGFQALNDWIEAKSFADKVTKHGLTAVFVPTWDVRVVLPLETKALLEAGLSAHYVLPGATATFSDGLSSIGLVQNVSKQNRQWVDIPFLIDNPWHGLGPKDAEFADPTQRLKVFQWFVNHLRELKELTGQKSFVTGRSAGGLTIPELVLLAPELISGGIAYSSPAPSLEAWQRHIVKHYEGNEDYQPGLREFIWFNGYDVAKQISVLKDHPDIEKYKGVKGIRAAFRALLDADPHSATRPRVLFVSGGQDSNQYPTFDHDVPEGSVYPDLPIYKVWPEAARRYKHVSAIVIAANGHFQWPTNGDMIRNLNLDIVKLFKSNPDQFNTTPGDGQEGPEILAIRATLKTLQALQDLTFALHAQGFTGQDLLDQGFARLKAQNDALSTAVRQIWPRQPRDEFADFVLTKPGKYT